MTDNSQICLGFLLHLVVVVVVVVVVAVVVVIIVVWDHSKFLVSPSHDLITSTTNTGRSVHKFYQNAGGIRSQQSSDE